MRLSAPGSGCCPRAPMMERCWRPCNAWLAVGKRHSAGWAGERFPRAVHERDPLGQYSGGGQAVGNADSGKDAHASPPASRGRRAGHATAARSRAMVRNSSVRPEPTNAHTLHLGLHGTGVLRQRARLHVAEGGQLPHDARATFVQGFGILCFGHATSSRQCENCNTVRNPRRSRHSPNSRPCSPQTLMDLASPPRQHENGHSASDRDDGPKPGQPERRSSRPHGPVLPTKPDLWPGRGLSRTFSYPAKFFTANLTCTRDKACYCQGFPHMSG